MFCTCVCRKSITQESLEPQFVINENEHVLDYCKKVLAKVAHLCSLGLIHISGNKLNVYMLPDNNNRKMAHIFAVLISPIRSH